MQVRFKPGVALVVTLVLLAGCGGSSSSDQTAKFKTSYASVAGQLRQISQAVGTAIEQASSQTNGQIGAAFHDLATRWQTQLSQLETLKPPSKQAADFNTLIGAATRAESDLTALVAAAATNSASAARQATATLVTDIAAAKSASTGITQQLGIK